MNSPYIRIVNDGLWHNNPGLVQLLGLCPLLAVSNTAINGLGLGLATVAVLIMANLCVSLTRHWLRAEIRIPIFVLIIASCVTTVELIMNAFWHELYHILGIFIPLIVTNCVIIGRAEAFASKHAPFQAALDGLSMGMGFTLVLVVLGSFREIVGQGTWLSQAHLMFGEWARPLTVQLLENYRGFLLAMLPPGAFIGLGLLIALKNVINAKLSRLAVSKTPILSEVEIPQR